MAGSQLKQLKAALQTNGLIGQTNIKRKNKKAKTGSETRRANDDSKNILAGIRGQFNQFDNKVNRNKHDYTIIQGGKFVKAGSKQHNEATKNRSSIENSLKAEYALNKKQHGRTGGIKDRRFGENNANLTAEEKMLARFTKEKQSSSKNGKKNVFSIGSEDEYDQDDDDDDDEGFTLTHSGKSLSFEDNEGLGNEGKKYVDEDQLMPEGELEQAPRRKTKQEVMKEVIAKSKYYKQQRQQEFNKAQDEIMDLDDDFNDIMGEINQSSIQKKKPSSQFSTKTPEEIEYDSKVRELTYDRRSVPADRTKTEEELTKEREEKMKKLETDRLNRMNGLDDRENIGDDLDDDFWAGNSEEEGEGIEIDEDENENDDEGSNSDEEDDDQANSKPRNGRTLPTISMPTSQEEFQEIVSKYDNKKQVSYIKKIIELYKPNLAMGNKEKMNKFVSIIFEQILYLSNEVKPNQELIESLIKILKKLAETFNESLVETIRLKIEIIQSRILNFSIMKSDLVFFIIIGYLFSTSDHYHLIVTPTLIIMNEFLSNTLNGNITSTTNTINEIGQGLLIIDTLLNYESFSKRYIPEVINHLEKSLIHLIPEPEKINHKNELISISHSIKDSGINLNKNEKFNKFDDENITLNLTSLFNSNTKNISQHKFNLIIKTIYLIDKSITLWKDNSSIVEIIKPFNIIFKHLLRYYASTLPKLNVIVAKFNKLESNTLRDRKPLVLQFHKALSIPTFTPKFEENFNPDKKSYDPNRERQEIGKMRHELKKEKKSMVKDFRKQTRFNAREQIKDKKQMYSEYHKKMSNIVDSIQNTDGAEKNRYERERQSRKGKK